MDEFITGVKRAVKLHTFPSFSQLQQHVLATGKDPEGRGTPRGHHVVSEGASKFHMHNNQDMTNDHEDESHN